MEGSASMIGWSASTLQSSTRSGLVSARRWQSPHMLRSFVLQLLAQLFDVLRAAVVIADGVDEEFEAGEADALEDLDDHFDDFGIDSGDSEPMASAPIWKNWR